MTLGGSAARSACPQRGQLPRRTPLQPLQTGTTERHGTEGSDPESSPIPRSGLILVPGVGCGYCRLPGCLEAGAVLVQWSGGAATRKCSTAWNAVPRRRSQVCSMPSLRWMPVPSAFAILCRRRPSGRGGQPRPHAATGTRSPRGWGRRPEPDHTADLIHLPRHTVEPGGLCRQTEPAQPVGTPIPVTLARTSFLVPVSQATTVPAAEPARPAAASPGRHRIPACQP